MTMVRSLGIRLAVGAALSVLLGCMPPSDQRPGLWLSGDEAAFPPDWSFSDAHREIALEVSTPYGLRHSVTIWCASLDGRLYVAARDPDEKRWPGWVEDRPDVRIGVDGRIYEGRLVRLDEPDWIARVRSRYAVKYQRPDPPPKDAPPMRYWRVEPRS
jgi:hypothetical protein